MSDRMQILRERTRFALRSKGLTESDSTTVQDIDAHCSQGTFSPAECVLWVYLIALARYPSSAEITEGEFILTRQKASDWILELNQSREAQKLKRLSLSFELVEADPEQLYLDVSHTLIFRRISGIQRVVRYLSRHLNNTTGKVTFLTFRGRALRPTLLSPNEHEHFLNWDRSRGAMRPPTFWDRLYGKWELLPFFSTKAYKRLAHPWLGMFFEILLRWVPARFKATFLLRRIILRARHWLMAEAFSEEWLDNPSNSPLKPFQKSFKVLVFTQGGKIHLPELAAEKTRVEFYLGIKQIWHSKIQFSMTLFDFIPILYPEFVTLHSGYLDYLRLLRVADKLSCISQEVANQAKCYVQILGRDQQVDVAAHLLPGDFDSLSEKQMPTSAPAERPLILCVGSIEIRKNQLALARAARALFERGYKFDLVFAGAPGWLSNEFLSEAFELRRRGFSVELLFHVPESMLRDLYSKCLLTVFPSFAEGFGLPIVESLRFGKPVIVSKKGCMGDLAKLVGGCVLVDPDSYEDIETALAKFIEKPALAQLLMSDVHLDRLPTWPQYAREVGQLLGHQ